MPTDTLVGLLGFVAMLSMVLCGIPIFVSMLSVCFVCVAVMPKGGWDFLVPMFTDSPFLFGANYQFAVLPLFMLLGMLAGATGVGTGAYNAIEKWTNWMPGGLMMATIGGNALFGAVSGMSTAANMVFCKIAMPELVKHGYDKSTSMGLITASGALDSLIPPSMPIIIFCVLAGNINLKAADGSPLSIDIGRALLGGVGPGIVLALIYCLIVFLLHIIRPDKVPGRPAITVTWMDRLRSLRLLLPVIVFFALIIGGTYWGWFNATVAGAIGSFILIVYGIFRGVGLKNMIKSAWEACVMNAGFFPIVIAGQMFGKMIALSRLPDYLADWIAAAAVPSYVVFLMVVVFYIFCGMIMDIASILIITIPIVVPLLITCGYSVYVIVIFLVMVGEMAGLTPPIGMNVFAVANALRVDPGLIFKGMWPFFLGEVVLVLIMPVVPWITTWIPDLLKFWS
jgi:tripartite ATP-independent transporter DctM subunit